MINNSQQNNEQPLEVDENFLDGFFVDPSAEPIDTSKKDFDPIKNMVKDDDLEIDFNKEEEEDEEVDKEDKGYKPLNSSTSSSEEEEEEKEEEEESEEEKEKKEKERKEKEEEEDGREVDAITAVTEMIESGELLGFAEDTPIKTIEDLKDLLKLNLENARKEPEEEKMNEYFQGLPEEIRIIKDYAEKGASQEQIRAMFRSLGEVQEIKDLNIEEESDQKEIIRQYLTIQNFGTAEDINEEIDSWEDLDKLQDKANKFLPKLEKIKEKQIQEQLSKQETFKKKQIEIQNTFVSGIKEALSKPEIVNLKLPKSDRDHLYNELTQYNHTSAINGRPLNGLGKVLEEITFVKPDPKFLSELTYFATNPEGFINKLTEKIKERENGKTVRKLRTEVPQSNKQTKKKGFVYRSLNDLNN